ncbi:MAG: MFS transporter [Caulobacteraceae bacterium]
MGARARRSGGERTYYALLVTQTVSVIGSTVSIVCVAIAVFQATGRVTPLALIHLFQVLPTILAGGVAGALADRLDRRIAMLIANLGFVACSGLLLAAFASGDFRLWQLYALSFAGALFATLERPAFQASVVMLVAEKRRDRANALAQLAGPVGRIAGPALGGLLYAVIGVTGAIAFDIATFLVAVVVLLLVRIPSPAASGEGRAMGGALWRQAFDGVRYLMQRPVLMAFCGYGALTSFLVGGVLGVGDAYILFRSGSGEAMGFVFAALNVGAAAGAFSMSVWGGTRPRIHTVFLSAVAGDVFLALAGVARDGVWLSAAFFGFMFVAPFGAAATASILQAKIAPDLQGRVFAAIRQIGAVLTPIAYVFGGPLADRVFEPARRLPAWRWAAWALGDGPGAGVGLMFVIAGALALLVTLAFYASPSIRNLEEILPDHGATA